MALPYTCPFCKGAFYRCGSMTHDNSCSGGTPTCYQRSCAFLPLPKDRQKYTPEWEDTDAILGRYDGLGFVVTTPSTGKIAYLAEEYEDFIPSWKAANLLKDKWIILGEVVCATCYMRHYSFKSRPSE